MFGMGDDPELTDADLVKAIRKRMLDEIGAGKRPDSERIVNNVYGGPIVGGGVMDQLGGGGGGEGGGLEGMSPEDRDYFVDIMRQDYDPGDEAMVIDPATGEKVPQKLARGGWSKNVHRYTSPKKKMME